MNHATLQAGIEVVGQKLTDSSSLTADDALKYSQAIKNLTSSMIDLYHLETMHQEQYRQDLERRVAAEGASE